MILLVEGIGRYVKLLLSRPGLVKVVRLLSLLPDENMRRMKYQFSSCVLRILSKGIHNGVDYISGINSGCTDSRDNMTGC